MSLFNGTVEAGREMFLYAAWGAPFVGMLLSIALWPLLAPGFWHRHFGKIAGFWTVMFVLPCAVLYGVPVAIKTIAHTLIAEYFPFIILLSALYTVAGGLCVHGKLHATPTVNTALLALGTALASVLGTTGASMLLIRPLLRANEHRQHSTHVVIFFIFLVANIGGALTPLGDPPLFLGFLNGVGFFWTTVHLFGPMLFVVAILLTLFYALDSYYFHRHEQKRSTLMRFSTHLQNQVTGADSPLVVGHEDAKISAHSINALNSSAVSSTTSTTKKPSIWIEGKVNFLLLAALLGAVLMSGMWQIGKPLYVLGTPVALQNLLRDICLIAIILISLYLTPASARRGNVFNWEPLQEVAQIFAAIFVTIVPVIALMRAGENGPFGFLISSLSDAQGHPLNAWYFWVTGLLSSLLDNAPTYLIFFNVAGGDAAHLMASGATTLAAISAGAVFMGANTYIGNAPNFMVRSIAQARGIRMPSFLGYMAWSGAVLIPIFILTTLLFFHN